MCNKKAGVAFEEITGFVTFMFAMFIVLLIFYGCSIFDAKVINKKIEVSTEQINVVRALNNFLEIPVSDKKVSDVLKEAAINKDFEEFEEIANKHFSEKYQDWRISVYDEDENMLYDSYRFHSTGGSLIAKADSKIIIPKKEGYEFVKILFEVREGLIKNV